jgi:threonine synthase
MNAAELATRGPRWPPAALPFRESDVRRNEPGLWRYGEALGIHGEPRITLGEVMTPLIEPAFAGSDCYLKLEHYLPSGSFKDRGAAVLVSRLRAAGVQQVVDDSSGNAGAALAAYCAAAGIRCTVLVPEGNSPVKIEQIRAYGAKVLEIPGGRLAATRAVRSVKRAYYASHVGEPAYLVGISTLGLEIWEQLGHTLPTDVVVPCGQGSLVLALSHAFRRIAAGSGAPLPRIHAVQSAQFPAVSASWAAGLRDVVATGGGVSLAEGIECRKPRRGRAVLAAIRECGGTATAVTENAIAEAWSQLRHAGFYVEPTGAVALAGLGQLRRTGAVQGGEARPVIVLTGCGRKAGLGNAR